MINALAAIIEFDRKEYSELILSWGASAVELLTFEAAKGLIERLIAFITAMHKPESGSAEIFDGRPGMASSAQVQQILRLWVRHTNTKDKDQSADARTKSLLRWLYSEFNVRRVEWLSYLAADEAIRLLISMTELKGEKESPVGRAPRKAAIQFQAQNQQAHITAKAGLK